MEREVNLPIREGRRERKKRGRRRRRKRKKEKRHLDVDYTL